MMICRPAGATARCTASVWSRSRSRSRSGSGLSGRLRLADTIERTTERTNERTKGREREKNNSQVRVEEGSCLLTRHVRGPCSVPCAASPSGSSCVCLDNKPVCHNQLDDQTGVLRERVSQRARARALSFRDARRETGGRQAGRQQAGRQGTTPGPEKKGKGKGKE